MKFGLKDETCALIEEVFKGFIIIDEVTLYGSRAKGNFKPASDIDFVLKGDNITLETMNKISWALDDLLLPYAFDMSIYSHITDIDLMEHIKRVGKVFYKNNQNLVPI